MGKRFVFVGILIVLPAISYGQSFRSDYTFDEKAGGWLKFHRVPLRWDQAHLTCYNEGAVLASPSSKDFVKVLSNLMVKHGVTNTPIFTGISNKISNSIQKSVEEYVLDNRTESCYKVYRDQQKWSDASRTCAAQGGHLAIINSQDEADVIWELAKDSLSVYAVSIGFRADGGYRYGRTWTTLQGESLEEAGYARWYTGEPNSVNENCGSVLFSGRKEDGILNDVSCTMDLTFICEIEPNTTSMHTTPTPTPTTPEYYNETQAENRQHNITMESLTRNKEVECTVPECDTLDQGYIFNNRTGSCYKVHNDTHTWTEAYHVCASEGGHLAVINSQEEAEVVWDLAEKSLAEYSIFVGYRAFGANRIWVTVQGQTLADAGYEKWNWGEPNNIYENCGGLNGLIDHGILNDVGCEIDLMFICEIEPRASTFMLARY